MTAIRSPMNDTEYLVHYGVKGMKWGVRKSSKTSSKSPSLFKKSSNKKTTKKVTKKTKKKRIKDMTDTELLKRRDRLRLEREVKTLTTETESTAKKILKRGLTRAGERVVEEIAHDTVKYLIGEQIINKYGGTKIVNIQTGNDEKKKKDKVS